MIREKEITLDFSDNRGHRVGREIWSATARAVAFQNARLQSDV